MIGGLLSHPRRLPSWLCHDATTSSSPAARIEHRLIADHSDAIARLIGRGGHATVIELGAGSSTTSEPLLRALGKRRVACDYFPADVSAAGLNAAAKRAAAVPVDVKQPRLRVRPLVCSDDDAFDAISALAGPKTVLFLGGGLAELGPEEARGFLTTLRRSLLPDDHVIVGVEHPPAHRWFSAANDDVVTSAFHRLALQRLNREAGAHFDDAAFDHISRWDPPRSRVEVFLESNVHQHIALDRLGVTLQLRKGELIQTRCSHKHEDHAITSLLEDVGFSSDAVFADAAGTFGVHVARAEYLDP
ncbi:MAG: L-histidine N(alpha)-methyltransferase [Deltaproteobacteria bacterium]|nr:L-histidine N(alpha)-methyltransferase [Deltaproteobacteria bacterium]